MRKFFEIKVNCRNLIKGINTWAAFLVRYSVSFSKWTREDLQKMDQRRKKHDNASFTSPR